MQNLHGRWTTQLGMTLPEMVFGENGLEIRHEAQGLEFRFKAYEALDACAREVDVQVAGLIDVGLCSTLSIEMLCTSLGGR